MGPEHGSMLVATLMTIEGRPVQWYLGIVSGEAILGGESVSCVHEIDLRQARDRAILSMQSEAAERGANAVLGVGVSYGPIGLGDGGTRLLVTASGTAVRV